MEKFFQALAALLPTGFAWPRDAGSTLMRVLRGVAGAFSEHHDFTLEAVRQWQPATTVNRLAEWEAATGLPDACFPAPLELLGPGRYAVDPVRLANFSRVTPATYIDDAGVRQTALANVARYEGGALVVEALAVNSLPLSETLTNAAWNPLNMAVTAVGGGVFRLTPTTATGLHRLHIVGPAIGDKVFTAEVKADGYGVLAIAEIAQVGISAAFNTSTGTATFNSLGVKVKQLAGGWWRLSLKIFDVANTDLGFYAIYVVDPANPSANPTLTNWTPDGTSGLLVRSAAIEETPYPKVTFSTSPFEPTSYIPNTTTATVTRAADIVYLFPLEAATRDLRRKLLLSRLRGPQLAYDNSSSASPGAIVAICAGLGYVATVAYNLPFRCGVNRVGDRLGALDGKLYVTVTLQSKAFRVGASRVGQRLLEGQLNGGELACYLQRVIPARYQLNMIFI